MSSIFKAWNVAECGTSKTQCHVLNGGVGVRSTPFHRAHGFKPYHGGRGAVGSIACSSEWVKTLRLKLTSKLYNHIVCMYIYISQTIQQHAYWCNDMWWSCCQHLWFEQHNFINNMPSCWQLYMSCHSWCRLVHFALARKRTCWRIQQWFNDS